MKRRLSTSTEPSDFSSLLLDLSDDEFIEGLERELLSADYSSSGTITPFSAPFPAPFSAPFSPPVPQISSSAPPSFPPPVAHVVQPKTPVNNLGSLIPTSSPFFSASSASASAPAPAAASTTIPSSSSPPLPSSRSPPSSSKRSRHEEPEVYEALPAGILGPALAAKFSYSPPEGSSEGSRRRSGLGRSVADPSREEVAPPRKGRVIEILDDDEEVGGATERKVETKRESDKLPKETDRLSKQDDWKGKGPAVEPSTLSAEQQRVLELMESGKNIFFTGCAGTGKSFLLKEIIKKSPRGSTFVTAMTGMAALGIGGTTLHKFAGIGLGEGSKEKLLEVALRSKGMKNWLSCRRLIVDEISMLDGDLFEKLDYIGKRIRKNPNRPFGGIQLLLSGDFFQLPPVSQSGRTKLCFQTATWKEIFDDDNMIELKKIFRQEEKEFVDLLSEVRFNQLSDMTIAKLESLQRPLECPNGIIPTKLYSTNMDVDSVNERFLRELLGQELPFGAKDYPESLDDYEKLFMAQKTLVLKPGAQVMLIKNLDSRFVNGSRGIVERFENETDDFGREIPGKLYPVVRFLNGELRRITPTEWKNEVSGGKTVARIQIPLKLAWAVTIHKSQGLTIDHLEVDLGGVFEYGQAYVALSRARTLKGLRVLSFNRSRIKSHPEVVAFYEHLAGLSMTSEERKEREAKKTAAQLEAKKAAEAKHAAEKKAAAAAAVHPPVPFIPQFSTANKVPVKVTNIYSSLKDPSRSTELSSWAKKPLESVAPPKAMIPQFRSEPQGLIPPKKKPSLSLQDPFKNIPQVQDFVKKPLELEGAGFTKASELVRKPADDVK